MRDYFVQRVRAVIARVFGIDRNHIEPKTDLNRDLGADSLDKLEVTIEMEDEFAVDIPDADALDIDTVEDAARLVEKQQPPT